MSRPNNKRKRVVSEDEDQEPDSKKQKIVEKESFKYLRTYDESEIRDIIKKNEALDKVEVEDIENGFKVIPPNYLLVKLDDHKRFIFSKRQCNELNIKLSSPTHHPELRVALKLEVFVTGDDVELDGVDDPNDTSHYLYVGSFSKWSSNIPVSEFQLWSIWPKKSLSAKAIEKLGSHVVDPNKKEKKEPEPPTAPSDLKEKLQRILAGLPSIDSLPKLNAPSPYPGTVENAISNIALSVNGNRLSGTAHGYDLEPVGRVLMNPNCPIDDLEIICFETARTGQAALLAGVAHSTKINRLQLMSMLMRGDDSSYSKEIGKVLAITTSLKTCALYRIHALNIDAICAGLNVCSTLNTLSLEHCGINDAHFEKLVAVLCNPASPLRLKILNLTGNLITEASGEMLQYLLEHNRTLEAICFKEIETLKEEFGPYLGRGLAKNKTLKRIHFTKTKLGARGAVAMFKEITKVNNTLEALNFEMCKIGKQGGDALVEFLKTNSSISFLHLGSAGIAEKTWPQLLKVIEDKLNIQGFKINKCDERIGDLRVTDLIKKSPRLSELDGRLSVTYAQEEIRN